MDEIPVSLFAQAAKETGWGTSHLLKKAMLCLDNGLGQVRGKPKDRKNRSQSYEI